MYYYQLSVNKNVRREIISRPGKWHASTSSSTCCPSLAHPWLGVRIEGVVGPRIHLERFQLKHFKIILFKLKKHTEGFSAISLYSTFRMP